MTEHVALKQTEPSENDLKVIDPVRLIAVQRLAPTSSVTAG